MLTIADYIMLGVGFFGALTLVYFVRRGLAAMRPPPTLTSHFSPKGGCTDVVVRELQNARHEILVQAYSFTSKAISQALVDAKTRGVHVEIILDHSNETEDHSDLPFLIEQGMAPIIDPAHAIAHNKIMMIDGRTLITGSFNFTRQAEIENAENLLVLKGYGDLIAAYRKQFAAHKSHSRQPEVKKGHAAPHHKAA